MRRTRVQPKDHRLVPIQDDLRDAMREVHQLLQDAESDPDISVDYDDAIQVGGLCGGRYRKGKRPFGFTYYPSDHDERGRWYLTLHPLEIEDIVDGVMTEIKMYCCTSPDCRTKFRGADETCFYCDYYDDGITPTRNGLPKSAEELARAAATDAKITDQKCPHCGQPCASYRKTCKHCRQPVNAA